MDALPKVSARPTSILQLLCLIAVFVTLPCVKTFGLDGYSMQQAYQPTAKAWFGIHEGSGPTYPFCFAPLIAGIDLAGPAPVSRSDRSSNDGDSKPGGLLFLLFRAFAVVCLVLVSAGIGAGVMLFALRQKSPDTLGQMNLPRLTKAQVKEWAVANRARIGSRIKATASRPHRSIQTYFQRASNRLVSLLPSRRLAFQMVCVAAGVALMVFSVYEFFHSEILTGFFVLILGYIIVASVWVLSWHTAGGSSGPDIGHDTLTTAHLMELFPRAVATIETNQIDEHLVTPAFDLGVATGHVWHHVDYAHNHAEIVAPKAARLRCDDCNKQFNVTGDGELAFRLIPCPHCGFALQGAHNEQASMSSLSNTMVWTPIISVHCGQCHRLIDVPYATIGSSTWCPSCEADLPVPDIEHRVKELRQLSSLMPA